MTECGSTPARHLGADGTLPIHPPPPPPADHEDLFRQESNFHWAFGVLEPDFLATIDVDTGR
jgi:hypothetical protein